MLDERSMPVVRTEAVGRVFSGATGFDAETLGALPLLLDRSRTAVEAAVHKYLERRLSWRRYFEAKAREARRRPAPRVPRLRDFFREAAPSCDRLREAGADAGIPLPVRLALWLEEQDSARDALDREALEHFFPVTRKTPPKTLPKELGADFRAVAECVREFRPVWLDFLNERAFGPVWEVIQAVEAEYQRLKRDRGVMDFDDLTVAATRLLEGLGEFSASRFRLEARYHHLLLDEFHDTSDAQWDLLRAILRPWSEGMGLAAEEGGEGDPRPALPADHLRGGRPQTVHLPLPGRARGDPGTGGGGDPQPAGSGGRARPASGAPVELPLHPPPPPLREQRRGLGLPLRRGRPPAGARGAG